MTATAGDRSRADAGAVLSAAIVPEWPVPDHVGALSTTRRGGVSAGPWGLRGGAPGGLNLGAACGDDADAVASNRRRLADALGSMPVWLDQVHGAAVHRVLASGDPRRTQSVTRADAAVTDVPGVILAVLTADCLPVLLTDDRGQVVAVAHAGWRGVLAGVLENAVAAVRALAVPGARIHAWFGPSIGPAAFEVGEEVRMFFHAVRADSACAFAPAAVPGKWLADLPMLARQRLETVGVHHVHGAPRCTVDNADDFYSWRRDGPCGRMATLVWIHPR